METGSKIFTLGMLLQTQLNYLFNNPMVIFCKNPSLFLIKTNILKVSAQFLLTWTVTGTWTWSYVQVETRLFPDLPTCLRDYTSTTGKGISAGASRDCPR